MEWRSDLNLACGRPAAGFSSDEYEIVVRRGVKDHSLVGYEIG